MQNNKDNNKQTVIDEIISSMNMKEPKAEDKSNKGARNQQLDSQIVKEEYEVLMDTNDPNYFIYSKNK